MSDIFLDSAEFKKIANEFFPIALQDQRERHEAYNEQLRPYKHVVATILQACEREIIAPLTKGQTRFIARLDRYASHTKSPASIDDKIFRYLSNTSVAGQRPPTESLKQTLRDNQDQRDIFLKIFFRELPQVMNDLARFRVVGNFLSDVHKIAERFRKVSWSTHGIRLDPNIEDRIVHDRRQTSASGHRAIHLRMVGQAENRPIDVEVQIMTLLETGWDAKSHMYYELIRRGNGASLDQQTKLIIQSMSDMLFAADVLFDEILQKFEHKVHPS